MISLEAVELRNPTYLNLLAKVPKAGLYLSVAVDKLLPFNFYGNPFSLAVSEVGIPVDITIVRRSDTDMEAPSPPTVMRIMPSQPVSEVRLPLGSGVNLVEVTSALGSMHFYVGAAHWATGLYAAALEIDSGVTQRLTERESAVLSYTGALQAERWFADADLLPVTEALHRLAMRLLLDGLSRVDAGRVKPPTNRSVTKLLSALTANNPVVIPTYPTRDNVRGPPLVRCTEGELQHGYDFHVWTLDSCTNAFVAAGRYLQNLSAYFEILAFDEDAISYRDVGSTEVRVLRNTGAADACSVEQILTQQGCFDNIRPWIRLKTTTRFVVCLASYPFDTSVEVCSPLGSVYFDCDATGLDTVVLDPDVVDEEDPTGDGWVHFQLDGRWDHPTALTSFDTMSGEVEAFSDIQCPYPDGPVVTSLMTSRSDIEIAVELAAFGSLNVIGSDEMPQTPI